MAPFNFTFNFLARMSLAEQIYTIIANTVNKYVLRRNTFLNTELIYDAFTTLDAFWLKHGESRWYNSSQVRVIIGIVLQSVRDNKLTSEEVRALSRYITTHWDPKIAQQNGEIRPATPSPELESEIARGLKIYDKLNPRDNQIPKFVENISPLLNSNLSIGKIIEMTRGKSL